MENQTNSCEASQQKKRTKNSQKRSHKQKLKDAKRNQTK